ncbi:hypothetical protein QTP88_010812 [Uroleucon formosanum]
MHLDQISGISKNQFGFRKGRSTIDAIETAMDVMWQMLSTRPLGPKSKNSNREESASVPVTYPEELPQ